jgi:hypothetical protein
VIATSQQSPAGHYLSPVRATAVEHLVDLGGALQRVGFADHMAVPARIRPSVRPLLSRVPCVLDSGLPWCRCRLPLSREGPRLGGRSEASARRSGCSATGFGRRVKSHTKSQQPRHEESLATVSHCCCSRVVVNSIRGVRPSGRHSSLSLLALGWRLLTVSRSRRADAARGCRSPRSHRRCRGRGAQSARRART